jgi:hypothetical protein
MGIHIGNEFVFKAKESNKNLRSIHNEENAQIIPSNSQESLSLLNSFMLNIALLKLSEPFTARGHI